ncbi:hypothetical protein TSUD_279390 [Trifolium subterraneum]|uniref:Retrotransposon gag domain-containing protein n=1 Tax=Trifolium subterraneum TaxID=3900 RepID=A0A2Z6NB95_TRISU|nr:hypothetical protein TSUD_279390 [Trifolium subterraneum]
MASGSNATNDGTNNNNVDVVPPFTLNTDDPIHMPVDNTNQPMPETDPRDGRETSLDSDYDDAIQIVNEQNTRIRALEDESSNRQPALECVQLPLQPQKRNRTPPREDAAARAAKKGKTVVVYENRPISPPRKKQLLLGGMTQGSRGDDYCYRQEDSPCRADTPTHSPGWSDDEVYRGPISKEIMDLELPRALIFPTTLVEGAMAWYRSLPQGSTTSWKDLCKQFTSHFTTSRKHPKTEVNLEAVVQGPNETLRSYIERFNKEDVQVDVTYDMKKYLMRNNLRDGTKFKEMVTIEKPATWDEILYKAQTYMQFEEETLADAMRYSRTEDNRPPREEGNRNGDKRNGDKRERDKSREPRGPPSQFTNYTPLLVP